MAVRVHELAREFRVESKTILSALAGMGEYVRSAASTVEKPVVLRLRDYFNSPEFTRPERRVSLGREPRSDPLGGNPFARRFEKPRPSHGPRRRSSGRPVTDPALLDAAKMFGVAPQSLRSAPKPWPKKKEPRKPGSHEIDGWDERLMDRNDRQAWMDAGLGDHDARIADLCRTYGITPDDLSLVVESRPVWDRLHGNESITIIADMIRVEKERHRRLG